jgi:hypothetical protein
VQVGQSTDNPNDNANTISKNPIAKEEKDKMKQKVGIEEVMVKDIPGQ